MLILRYFQRYYQSRKMNEFVVDTKKYPKPRSRHHNAANVYFALHELEKTPKYYPPIITSINWNEVFSNGMPPNVLDIGCGWGSFLLNYAQSHPKSNILGIEIRKILTDWINAVITGEQIQNAHSLWYSLPNGLPFLEDSSIDTFFSFFPDPWVKKKHHKRRAFSQELVHEIIRLAKDQATLHIMTDVPEVADYQIALLKTFPQITQTYAEFIGTTDSEWETVFKNIQKNMTDTSWNLPHTDQEIFSKKKGISYLRLTYLIRTS